MRLDPRIDTDVNPTFQVYSAGNFAEVAPERLSIMSWSLVGEPMELATRSLVQRIAPYATWHQGSSFTFLGYFSCRPFHNLVAFCRLTEMLPRLQAKAVVNGYFEGIEVPSYPQKGREQPPHRRPGLVARMIRELSSLRPRLVGLEGDAIRAEQTVATGLTGTPVALGMMLRDLRSLIDRAWDVHMATTSSLVPLQAMQAAVNRRLLRHAAQAEPWLTRPQELVWDRLHSARDLDLDVGPGEFLNAAFYEVADTTLPWSQYASRNQPLDQASRSDAGVVDPATALLGMLSRPRRAIVAGIATAAGDVMAAREWSKSLVMRSLHLARRMLPPVADAVGIPREHWPYLMFEEVLRIAEGTDPYPFTQIAKERRQACEQALTRSVPDYLDFGCASTSAAEPEQRPVGRGVSPGSAVGSVIHAGSHDLPEDLPLVLVAASADADVQPLLHIVDGVVTARGSELSHIAILAREYGIPAVVSHPIAGELAPGENVYVNGLTGEVRRVDT